MSVAERNELFFFQNEVRLDWKIKAPAVLMPTVAGKKERCNEVSDFLVRKEIIAPPATMNPNSGV